MKNLNTLEVEFVAKKNRFYKIITVIASGEDYNTCSDFLEYEKQNIKTWLLNNISSVRESIR